MRQLKRPATIALLVAGALAALGALSYFALAPTTASPVVAPAGQPPVFRDASVHDPSVIKVGDTFYVFGSHLAAAKTKDLMQWDVVADGVTPANPLFDNVVEELRETFAWAQASTLWAADVIQLRDGRFYMYYNACKGDSPRSALGVAVADTVEGPYKNLGIVLKSGMWGQPSEDGTIYDARIHPNVVDPDAFYDADGQLWMVYGSYSGGIFILRLDEATGKPLAGQGYGKKLVGGNHSRIEGPFILYSPQTKFYYLFLSFGGLDANGGYNIRVARAERPDGPYYDAAGTAMSDVKADPAKPLFDDRSIEPYGVKLMGNFVFERAAGDGSPGVGAGYVSPGHNSAYYDPATGQYFLIFHTRFPGQGERHQIRVHQMFMNDDGWPAVAPYRYAGETAGPIADEVAGRYQYVSHGRAISAAIAKPQLIELEPGGAVSGAASGSWERSGDNALVITIGGERYSGVFVRQWEPQSQTHTLTFTALSQGGVAIWGSKVPEYRVTSKSNRNTNCSRISRIFANMAAKHSRNPCRLVGRY